MVAIFIPKCPKLILRVSALTKFAEQNFSSDVQHFKQLRWPGWLPPATKQGIMCNKCDEIDKTILRYRNIQRRMLDQMLVDGAQKLIDGMETDKRALHPEKQK